MQQKGHQRRRGREAAMCLVAVALAVGTGLAPAAAQGPVSGGPRAVGPLRRPSGLPGAAGRPSGASRFYPGREAEAAAREPVRRGQGQRVSVRGEQGESVIGILHADVGPRRLVIMPDGQLREVPVAEAPLSEEKFVPATKTQIAESLKAQGLVDFKVRSTARFVYVYNTSEAFYRGTSRILETMYPAVLAYFKRLKLPVHDPEVPLVAIMFRTEEEFRKFDDVPEGIVAYYNTLTNYVVMYEQSDLVEVAPELAMKQSIGTIAHEGIHQILHNIGVQERLSKWPLWLAEGLAEYFAPTTVDRRLRWKGVGMPNDLRMYELADMLKRQPDETGAIVSAVVRAPRLTSTGYAAAWSLTHYLASREKQKFNDYLIDVARLGPLEPEGEQSATLARATFEKHFGTDYAALQKEMIAHLKSLPYVDPIANQTHYVVLLDSATMRRVSITTSPGDARKFQQDTLSELPASARAATRFQIVPFANAQSAREYANRFLGGN